jgi:DNA-binding XRE family transcriptional regulator
MLYIDYMKTYKQLKTELLKDKEIKRAYEKLGPEFSFIEMVISKRIKKGITQKELAEKINTRQSSISRFESGAYNPSLTFLRKIADALDAKVKISLSEK